MSYIDPISEKWEYEERVRWLQSLYGSHADSSQPGLISRGMHRLMSIVGKQLVSLGERMQPDHNLPASAPMPK